MPWRIRVESERYDYERGSWVADSVKFGPYLDPWSASLDTGRVTSAYLAGRDPEPARVVAYVEGPHVHSITTYQRTPDGKARS